MKTLEKEIAIRLRREGKTYREIMAEVPIAKSTLSEWLRSVQLAKSQQQRITQKRLLAAQRGADIRKRNRLLEIANYTEAGMKDIGNITPRELWLIGVVLYWAEGSKQRESDISTGIVFGNSDPGMIRTFLHWLGHMGVPNSDTHFELYVHDTRRTEALTFARWWAKQIGVSPLRINHIYFKRGNIKTNRKNIGDLYHGLLRIKVRSSTALNRQVNGWAQGVVASLGDRLTAGQVPLKH